VSLALDRVETSGLSARLIAAGQAVLAHQHGRFGPWLAVALGAGVLAYFGQAEEPGEEALWLALPVGVLAFWLARRAPLAGWGLGLAAAVLLGFGISAWHASRLPPPLLLPRTAVQLTGLVAAVEQLPAGRRVTLEEVRLDGGDALPRSLRIRLRANDPADRKSVV